MSIRFSIIIPVYNVEKYLDECFESVLSQKFGNFEIICVDDCSTDNSWNILEKYAEKDKRIRIFKQEKNAGQGVARNRALDLAQGEYVLFVDPDDWIETDSLNILNKELTRTNAEVLCFGAYDYEETTDKIEGRKEILRLTSEFVLNHAEWSCSWKDLKVDDLFCSGAVWDKCYGREFIKKKQIHFAPTRIGEDNLFSLNSLLSAEKIFFIEESLYYYRIRKNSSITKLSDENFCVFENIEQMEKLIRAKGLEKELEKAFEKYKITSLRAAYSRLPINSRKNFKKEIADKFSDGFYKKVSNKLDPSVLEKIFSITNKNIDATKHKIIRIFGMEFVLPCKKKKLEEKK